MLTLFLHLIAASLCASAQPLPHLPVAPSGLDYKIDANVTYFTSTTNWASGGGSTADLPNGGYFTDIIGKALYTQDLDKSQRIYGGLTYSQTESSNGINTRTNNGVNEILAGGQMWFKLGSYDLVADGDLVYPLYRVDTGGDDALLGEGAMKIRTAGWFIYPWHELKAFLYLGYEYRDEGRSHAIPYSLGAKYSLSKNFWLQGEYRGYEKLFDNSDTDNRNTRDQFLLRVNGGSYRYYALNSAMSEIAGSAGYTFGTITAYGEAAYIVNGSSVADGLTFMLGLAYTPAGRVSGNSEFSDDEMIDSGRRTRRTEPIEDPIPASDDGFISEPDPRVAPPTPPPPPPPPPPPAPPAPPSEGGNVKLEMRRKGEPAKRPAVPRPAPKPKPKTKKDKIDKILKSTEDTLKDL